MIDRAHPDVRRRRQAIDRLRGLTSGAALAGVAGTAAFGLLAAASWSGNPNVTTATDVGIDAGGATVPQQDAPQQQAPQATVPGTIGNGSTGSSGASASNGTNRVRPVQPGTGTNRRHATTGGSG